MSSDNFLDDLTRREAMKVEGKYEETIALLLSLMRDETAPIAHRARAASALVRRRSACGEAMSVLRCITTDLALTSVERADGLAAFADATLSSTALAPLIRAVALDPTTSMATLAGFSNRMPIDNGSGLARLLLVDRTADVEDRVACRHYNDNSDQALEAVLRDVLTTVESTTRERVKAARILATLSHAHAEEAARLLEEIGGEAARIALAELGHGWRTRIVDEERAVLDDPAHPWRRRLAATNTVWRLTELVDEPMRRFLHDLARQEGVSDSVRLVAHERVDDWVAIRRHRDDSHARPATRMAAAVLLRGIASDDRATGARLLESIASDPENHPRLRRIAAVELLRWGTAGRALGVPALLALAEAPSTPPRVRADAWADVAHARPDLRGRAVRALNDLAASDDPLTRLHALRATGPFTPTPVAVALRTMAEDRAHPPGLRLRTALAMHDCRRDLAEAAAVVAREVAHDDTAPAHIRVKAARALAHRSDLCRGEAQALLVALGAASPR